MAVTNHHQPYAWVVYFLTSNQLREGFEKHCVILYFADSSNYGDDKFVIPNPVFFPQIAMALYKLIRINAKWDHSKLFCSTNIEVLRDLTALLFADCND